MGWNQPPDGFELPDLDVVRDRGGRARACKPLLTTSSQVWPLTGHRPPLRSNSSAAWSWRLRRLQRHHRVVGVEALGISLFAGLSFADDVEGHYDAGGVEVDVVLRVRGS